jgi:hypothetical protein
VIFLTALTEIGSKTRGFKILEEKVRQRTSELALTQDVTIHAPLPAWPRPATTRPAFLAGM